MFWRIPSWSGDYEILPHPNSPDTMTRVRIVNPTAAEIAALTQLFKHAKKKRWLASETVLPTTGTAEIDFTASVTDVGVYMARNVVPSRGRLTAIRSKDGSVDTVFNDAPVGSTEAERNEAADREESEIRYKLDPKPEKGEGKEYSVADVDKKPEEKKPEVATTVKAPTRCCPYTTPGPDARASEVLSAFLTEDQQRTWDSDGFFFAVGHRTGHRYRICHRHSPMAVAQGKSMWDVTDDHVVHVYDHSVPPAEEALAMKLYTEHHEEMVRNQASLAFMNARGETSVYTGFGRRHRLEDPTHPGFSSGTGDAALWEMMGQVFQMQMKAGRISFPRPARTEDDWDF